MKVLRLQEPALTLLLEEVETGQTRCLQLLYLGYFPGGRECVPNFLGTFFLGMASEEKGDETDDEKP